jgi:hypothetical protein
MLCKRAQIATEYLIVTGVILVIVSIIFAYSYSTSDNNIRVSKAGAALDKLANKANLVYAFGPDNNQFVEVELPTSVVPDSVRDITVCNDGTHVHDAAGQKECEDWGGVNFGAVELQLNLIGGISTIRRPVKAEVEMDFDDDPPYVFPSDQGFYRVKVFWCGERICLKRV